MTTLELETHRRQAHTAAGELSYLDVGAGPVALFVHGVGTNALLWRRVIEQVANERRRCIAVDLPLHGRSPAAPGQDFSMPALAEAVEALCEQLGLTGIDLVANDTGGAIAQVFAAHHPEQLASLCLTNCETHDNVPPPAFRATVRAARIGVLALTGPWVVKDPARARKSVFRNGYEDHRQPPDEIVDAFLRPVLGTRERARQFQRWVTAQRAEDLLAVEPALRRLQAPTLVVWGTGDVFFDVKWAHWLRATIPGVREVVEIDGARLFFPDERADELVPHLLRHWAHARG